MYKWFTCTRWWISIAMLNYQRLSHGLFMCKCMVFSRISHLPSICNCHALRSNSLKAVHLWKLRTSRDGFIIIFRNVGKAIISHQCFDGWNPTHVWWIHVNLGMDCGLANIIPLAILRLYRIPVYSILRHKHMFSTFLLARPVARSMKPIPMSLISWKSWSVWSPLDVHW